MSKSSADVVSNIGELETYFQRVRTHATAAADREQFGVRVMQMFLHQFDSTGAVESWVLAEVAKGFRTELAHKGLLPRQPHRYDLYDEPPTMAQQLAWEIYIWIEAQRECGDISSKMEDVFERASTKFHKSVKLIKQRYYEEKKVNLKFQFENQAKESE